MSDIEMTQGELDDTERAFVLWAMGEYLGFTPTPAQRKKIADHALNAFQEGYRRCKARAAAQS